MAKMAKIKGLNTVIRNLTRAKGILGRDVARGLKKGGLFLQGKSEDIVPVQIGTLIGSSFCRNVGGSGFDADIVVGYTTLYAVYVHENLDAVHGKAFNIKYAAEIAAAKGTPRGTAQGGMFERGEDEQAKFLEKPARQNKRRIIKIIQREAKVR